jgi:hypothetical protein
VPAVMEKGRSARDVLPARWPASPVSLLTDLQEFVHDHRPHDGITADATESH